MTKSISSYVGSMFTNPQAIRIAIWDLDDMTLSIPVKQEGIDDNIAKILLMKELVEYVNRRKLYRQNKSTLYYIVIGKCMEATKNCLEGEGSFEEIDRESDVIKLMDIRKSISYASESKSYPFLAIHQSTKAFYAYYQKTMDSCDWYIWYIANLCGVIVHCVGSLGDHPFLVKNKFK